MLSLLDYAILLLYLLALLILGFIRSQKAGRSVEEFVVAGRSLSLPAFVATLVSTWYGGILGVGEFSYQFGVSNWLVFGVPYYLYALLFAAFLAHRAWRNRLLTIPEQLERTYGTKVAMVGALFVFLVTTPAPYVLMLGVLCQMMLGWPLWIGVLVGTFFSIVYSFRGGFGAVVRTEILQFILMYAGFVLILIFAFRLHGGWSFLKESLPATHLTWHGGNSPQYIIVWYFIAMSTLADPTFYQRCFAARSASVARWGIIVSVICWIIFDFMTTTTGLYAAAILRDLQNPVAAFPELGLKLLPSIARGIFFVALLATIMSTIDGFSFMSAVTIGRDLLAKITHNESAAAVTRYTRLGLVISFVLAAGIALWAQSVVAIWYQLGTIVTPALMLPLVTSFSTRWRMSPNAALMAMISGALITVGGMIGKVLLDNWPALEPIYPGLLVALLILIVDRFRRRP